MERYFLDKNGAKTKRMQGKPGGGHYDIAKEVLSAHGVVPVDRGDYYQRMFDLGFARVLEQNAGTVQVEHKRALTGAQKRFLDGLESSGKRVIVNAGAFIASRATRAK